LVSGPGLGGDGGLGPPPVGCMGDTRLKPLVLLEDERRRLGVEYTRTDLGQTLVEPIEVLTNWARDYGGAIADFQEAAEATTPARARVTG
jgi:hypothetical protein